VGFACPLRSALRVWLPSRRLAPFGPVPALFHAGGAPGILPSERSPLGRHPLRFRSGLTHLPFFQPVMPRLAPGPVRLAAVPGSRSSRESLAIGHVFSATAAGCSHGIHSSRAFRRRPCLGFRPSSSRVLSSALKYSAGACTSEYRSASTWPRPLSTPKRARRTGQPS
jgi:hypothetical protein